MCNNLPEGSAQESVNKSFVRVRLYYLYLPMDVCTIFLHIFNKKFWLQFICNAGINMYNCVMRFLRPLLKHLMCVCPSFRL